MVATGALFGKGRIFLLTLEQARATHPLCGGSFPLCREPLESLCSEHLFHPESLLGHGMDAVMPLTI